ncbi:hypothetical protein L4G92_08815 [Neisseria sp. ZJ106]|uniref:Uncharacterized protein n=1 Tax=Neisseria lisongii TaxID=2912188 RepID=A0ABY7RHZ3_9NEIS|nr:hypothetical protein [Neisseria lisongii]MCF7522141.1 hypothetical protein [Neisseria lisongii]WCL70947.1 hypothetical protein PJU73_06175 [Neisseria lisongii]
MKQIPLLFALLGALAVSDIAAAKLVKIHSYTTTKGSKSRATFYYDSASIRRESLRLANGNIEPIVTVKLMWQYQPAWDQNNDGNKVSKHEQISQYTCRPVDGQYYLRTIQLIDNGTRYRYQADDPNAE